MKGWGERGTTRMLKSLGGHGRWITRQSERRCAAVISATITLSRLASINSYSSLSLRPNLQLAAAWWFPLSIIGPTWLIEKPFNRRPHSHLLPISISPIATHTPSFDCQNPPSTSSSLSVSQFLFFCPLTCRSLSYFNHFYFFFLVLLFCHLDSCTSSSA